MRIKELDLPLRMTNDLGVKKFKSDRIGSVIALVGKNGSGKTRYLKIIENWIKNSNTFKITNSYFDHLPLGFDKAAEKFKPYYETLRISEALKNIDFELSKDPKNSVLRNEKAEIVNKKDYIIPHNIQSQIKQFDNSVSSSFSDYLKVIDHEQLRGLQKAIEGKDQLFRGTFSNRNHKVDEFSVINQNALAYLESLPKLLEDAKTQAELKKTKIDSNGNYIRFQQLKGLVNILLEKELSWECNLTGSRVEDGQNLKTYEPFLTLNGLKFDYELLSEGEKVLFTYSILFFSQSINQNPGIRFSEWIIIIDEPELHLHPKAQVRLIERLKELVNNKGQLIIATHSIPIVASLDYSSIYLVQNDEMYSPKSDRPFKALNDIMGIDEYYYRMAEFLKSPSLWAMTNFMVQCFLKPEVIEFSNDSDPQIQLFKKTTSNKKNLNILDFGCGEGRLLTSLKEDADTWSRIKLYDTFDIDKNAKQKLKEKGAHNFYSSLKDIPKNKYHLIVLINVLHEIPIDEWKNTLNSLKKCLLRTGQLIFIEDSKMPVGELPNDEGFILLGKEEFKILFRENNVEFLQNKLANDIERMVCAIVSKSRVSNEITDGIIIETLESLKRNSFKELESLRSLSDEERYKNHISYGRTFGLKSNLHINSQLAINKLNHKK